MAKINKFLIVVGGPTASGKTSLAIRLAKHFETEILSVDSRQFYREMSIGTAKPDKVELAAAKHHFIDSISIQEPYSVGQYERQAIQLLGELFQKKEVVIMTGGSGLFINAVCQGLDDFPEVSEKTRKKVIGLYEEKGIAALQQIIKENDFDYYQKVDLQNKQRMMRAVEVILESGRAYSSFLAKNQVKRDFIPIFLQVHHPRKVLYERINLRVELMIKAGLIEEVKSLMPYRINNALQTVGYQEIFDYLDGNISLERAIELIQQNSRRYAKRQITWLRRDGFWKHIRPDDWNIALDYIRACREQGLTLQQYSKADRLSAELSWEKGTEMMLALWEKAQLKASVRLIKKGKKIVLESGDTPTELFLQHEVLLVLEELNN